ncbi:hypothetical protein ABIE21_003077 [Conyzicola nivalis]|uniref:Uncharacterized protein n=1 Tax=Conyzicola nivalis TaxID=1477021 RepID=A0ABV2QR44_9MICO
MSAETPNPADAVRADADPTDAEPANRKRRISTVALAGIAVVVSVAWYISFVFGVGMPTGLRVGLVVVGGVAAPSLAVFAAVRLAAPALGLSHTQARALLALAILAFAAVALVGVSFSVGMDEGDAGRPKSLLASLTGPFALVAIIATAAAVTLPMFAVLRRRRLGVPAATAIAVGVGVVATPLLLVSLLSPASIVGLCVVVFVFALVRSMPRAEGPAGSADDSAVAVRAPDISAVRARVTLFAGIALATSLVVWTTGFGVSILDTGTDVAGSALGISAALAQLAVVPLLWAATLAVAARLPRSADAARVGFAAASVVVVVSVAGMVVGFSPAGDVYIATAGVLSIGVALWAGAIVWSLTAAWPTGARAGAAVVTVVAAAAVYAVLVALSGGVTLALVSGFVAFGGSRLLLRSSPATLPAS